MRVIDEMVAREGRKPNQVSFGIVTQETTALDVMNMPIRPSAALLVLPAVTFQDFLLLNDNDFTP